MSATVGVADHAGWAVLMTIGRDHRVLDRRRAALLDDGLPCLPHHHEAQGLPMADALALIARVRASAERQAAARLDELARAVGAPIAGVALRACPPLPPTVEARIASYHAQTRADSVMYREALAQAAAARGWPVAWYDPRRVHAEAAAVLGDAERLDALVARTGAALGPPWRQDHRVAMAAAIAISGGRPRRR